MKNNQQGFTLIELMIVVAIIAILAAIALPQYQNYVAKSQFTAGLAELSGGKTAYEEMINDGRSAAILAEGDIGLTDSTRCNFAVTTPDATSGAGTITCVILGANPKVNGKIITLARDTNGVWTCSSDLTTADSAKYAPATCQA